MSSLFVSPDTLRDVASKVDAAADDLDSVAFSGTPDLGPSTSSVSITVEELGRRATSLATGTRGNASNIRGAAVDFTVTDTNAAQGAQSIGSENS